MNPKDGYLKTTLAQVPYLLPYGQNVVDQRRGLVMNPTSSLLWDGICRGMDVQELLGLLIEEFEAGEEELPRLKKDLDVYLKELVQQGLVSEQKEGEKLHITGHNRNESAPQSIEISHPDFRHFMRLGPLTISLDGPADFFQQYFGDFACTSGETDQAIILISGRPVSHPGGMILVRTEEVIIFDSGSCYVLIYTGDTGIYEMQIEKDGSRSRIYCVPDFLPVHRENIFHAIRFAFLVLAQQKELYVLHSASLLYRGQAWLFSGRSGAGKSTHTGFWKEEFQTPLLNGDLNLLGIQEGIPTVYGLPWCGTSGIYTSRQYPLGGIVFIKQSSADQVLVPAEDKKLLSVIQRMISPAWTSELLVKNINFAQLIVEKVSVFRLLSTKNPAAAHLMKAAIDETYEKEAP